MSIQIYALGRCTAIDSSALRTLLCPRTSGAVSWIRPRFFCELSNCVAPIGWVWGIVCHARRRSAYNPLRFFGSGAAGGAGKGGARAVRALPVRVVCVAKSGAPALESLAADYASKIQRYCQFHEVLVKPNPKVRLRARRRPSGRCVQGWSRGRGVPVGAETRA